MNRNQHRKEIYLDNSMAAAPSPAAVGAMTSYLTNRWGVASAPHARGQALFPGIEEGLRNIYTLLGASDDDDIIITGSGAEAVNHVVSSVYRDLTKQIGKNHFIIASTDEAPAIMATGFLEENDCAVTMLDAGSDGVLSVEQLAEAITPRTVLLSLSWGNGLTGTIHDVAALAPLCRERGILLHLDATHILGKLYFDLKEVGADFITFNGEQLHGVPGTGALWVRHGCKLSSFVLGGTEQGGLRAGNLNVPGLVALGVAAEEALDNRDYLCTEIARLRDKLEQGVVAGFPSAQACFRETERLPHISAITFPGIANEALLFALDRVGVSACIGGGGFQQIGMNLQACSVDVVLAHSTVSFSLSRETTEEAINHAIERIVEAAQRLSRVSQNMELPQLAGEC
ncbi:Cysteine desulfurase IscS [Chlamydiales bacterium SCGC AG-110-P3]|nr:Cysteine desulfurase IscS [Chlamydiales bacterium SCGC AG-110-P3]